MRSTAAFGRLEQFHLEPELDVGRTVQRPDAARPFFEKRTEPAGSTPTEVSFGPFRLLRTQFLLLEGDKPVPLGSRYALGIMIAFMKPPALKSSSWRTTAQDLVDRGHRRGAFLRGGHSVRVDSTSSLSPSTKDHGAPAPGWGAAGGSSAVSRSRKRVRASNQ